MGFKKSKKSYRDRYSFSRGKKSGVVGKNRGGHEDDDDVPTEVDPELERIQSKLETLVKMAKSTDRRDKRFGFAKMEQGAAPRVGWLLNMQSTLYTDVNGRVMSGVDYYFLEDDGGRFKVTYPYLPYFYIKVKDGTEVEIEQYLKKKFDTKITLIERIHKEDLELPNHLVGLKQLYIKLSFLNVHDLMHVKSKISPYVRRNKAKAKEGPSPYDDNAFNPHANAMSSALNGDDDDDELGADAGMVAFKSRFGMKRATGSAPIAARRKHVDDIMNDILDLREHDVPYQMRVSIDERIYAGKWYDVKHPSSQVTITCREDIVLRPELTVLAWDIETSKLPLKFPDKEKDEIIMISYMINGVGFLIVNRERVAQEIEDFAYTPKPQFPGEFEVFNMANEEATIRKFFEHIQEVKPHVMVTYNGDFFDWPFVERRAEIHGMSMYREIGFRQNSQEEYVSTFSPHLDCFRWVKRDSYLPVGSHGLKAVTRKKLGYNPMEIHYEDICRMALEEPQTLANYSVSDAVATYYLFMKYVNPFIFALCTIIPLPPDDVLRKGSGTLCESLLMGSAYSDGIIMPNKKQAEHHKMFNGHLLESETYVGGHVEGLESGVYRDDIPCWFRLVPQAVQELIDNLDATLKHALVEEEKVDLSVVTNFDEIKQSITERLEELRDNPYRQEVPLIYHLDVSAMYPNIILSNRLQPPAVVDEKMCAACDFNRKGSNCQRKMEWMWRGEVSPASLGEYQTVKASLEQDTFPAAPDGDKPRAFHELNAEEQATVIKKRLANYTRRVYKRTHDTKMIPRIATVCQRENPFYINTVRNFRDRRYIYKRKLKETQKKLKEYEKGGDVVKAKEFANLEVLYDSLQLAHKCILNSFYGYVMRKGARWYSMEMAGVVCLTGANIITRAREIVEQIGIPLELDTDGIWCCLPGSFPEDVTFTTTRPGKDQNVVVSYPCALLNIMVRQHFTNHQYQDLVDPASLTYEVHSENSILFEVDGPYKAMVLPASQEKGKSIKKRYAVFDKKGNLCELKGFELKRNGELEVIKIFQKSVFSAFLKGTTLEEVYDAVAGVANHWLDVLYSQGEGLADSELFHLISENKTMSKTLKEYEGQKSTSITTAKRLAQFLGADMVREKGLACQFIISRKPAFAPVTERAIPIAIFQAMEEDRKYYLRKWTKEPRLESFDIRSILDWGYYIERLGSAIQKIITIPAAFQKVPNPVPRVAHPDWLQKQVLEKADKMKQKRLTDMFSVQKSVSMVDEVQATRPTEDDIEDQFADSNPPSPAKPAPRHHKALQAKETAPMIMLKRRVRMPNGKVRVMKEEVTSAHWRDALGQPPQQTDFSKEWLAYHKKKWKIQRAQRQIMREMGVSTMTMRARGTADTSSASRAMTSVATTHWEILQIRETSEPGVMNVWCIVAGDLHCMRVNIPRKFYVNLRSADTSGTRERVKRNLPRRRPCLFLYEFEMNERDFQSRQRLLSSRLSHPDVEGVYEMNIPLIFTAIMELGCVACIDPRAAMTHRPGRDLDLSYVNKLDSSQFSYLSSTRMHHAYFLHAMAGKNRGLYAIFFPSTQQCHLVVVDPSRGGARHITQQWQQFSEEMLANAMPLEQEEVIGGVREDGLSHLRVQYKFSVVTCMTEKDGQLAADKILQDYIDEGHAPTTISFESPLPLTTLETHIPTLQDFPLVQAPCLDDLRVPAMQWQTAAIAYTFNRYHAANEWYFTILSAARYAQIPIGNMPPDFHSFTCDVVYARHLRKEQFLLWASPSHFPDLGGSEMDDNRIMSDDASSLHFETSRSGVYNTCCVDLTVESMSMSAVLYHALINHTEGDGEFEQSYEEAANESLEEMVTQKQKKGNVLTIFDENAQVMPAFKVLVKMMQQWLRDLVHKRKPEADELLVQFFRWMKTPDTLLFDPALLRLVNTLQKKMFFRLKAELEALGSKIVYATLRRFVLVTNKTRASDAYDYVEYLKTTLQSNELFYFIHFRWLHCYEHLVWLDPENYCGVLASAGPQADEGEGSTQPSIAATPARGGGTHAPNATTAATPAKSPAHQQLASSRADDVPQTPQQHPRDPQAQSVSTPMGMWSPRRRYPVDATPRRQGRHLKPKILADDSDDDNDNDNDNDDDNDSDNDSNDGVARGQDSPARRKGRAKQKKQRSSTGQNSEDLDLFGGYDFDDEEVEDDEHGHENEDGDLTSHGARQGRGRRNRQLVAEEEEDDDDAEDRADGEEPGEGKSATRGRYEAMDDSDMDVADDGDRDALHQRQDGAEFQTPQRVSQRRLGTTQDDAVGSSEEGQISIDQYWNIAEYLPPEYEQVFVNFVAEWVSKKLLLKNELKATHGRAEEFTPIKRRVMGSQPSQKPEKEAALDEQILHFVESYLMSAVHKMKTVIADTEERHLALRVFPKLPGAHLKMTDPTLEFVKFVCKILTLEQKNRDRYLALRRDLLRQLGVGEFADVSRYQPPCLSFVVSEVVCHGCAATRSIDLSRDHFKERDAAGVMRWKCPRCNKSYDSKVIEQQLIDVVNHNTMQYQIQDLRCLKCHRVKANNIVDKCDCSGNFAPSTLSQEQITHTLRTMESIASSFELVELKEAAQRALMLV